MTDDAKILASYTPQSLAQSLSALERLYGEKDMILMINEDMIPRFSDRPEMLQVLMNIRNDLLVRFQKKCVKLQ